LIRFHDVQVTVSDGVVSPVEGFDSKVKIFETAYVAISGSIEKFRF